ncbi:MAG TPA: DEAD/DEAH box helicase [Acidobacteriota bacterium]|nr:DEAD/DEAH box helicase [Acidobacteriota bacterium]
MIAQVPTQETVRFWIEKLGSPESVGRSFGSQVFSHGKTIYERGLVEQLSFHEQTLHGRVRGSRGRLSTSWTVTPAGYLRLECQCRKGAYCEHQIALYLAAYGFFSQLKLDKKPVRPARVVPTVPALQLSYHGKLIRIYAELASRKQKLRWPICRGEPRAQRGFVCDPRRMQEIFTQLSRSCETSSDPGWFELRLGVYSSVVFLFEVLPELAKRADVTMDAKVKALVSGKAMLRVDLNLKPAGSTAPRPSEFALTWNYAAGDRPLSGKDARRLREFYGYVFDAEDGRPVYLEPGRVHRLRTALSRLKVRQPGGKARRFPIYRLPEVMELAPEQTGQLAASLKQIFVWITDPDARPQPGIPPRLSGVLRPYQEVGVRFLNFIAELRAGGILADEMGLGKTVQALTLLEIERVRSGRKTSLVVCPTSVGGVWIEEAHRFTPDLKAVFVRSSAELQEIELADYDLVILSYALVRRNRLNRRFRAVILDEAQNIKNPRSQTAASVKALQADFRLALTGTPVENSSDDLWSIVDFLMPGLLGSLSEFRRDAAERAASGADGRSQSNSVSRLQPFLLRRMKQEVAADLPEKTEQVIECRLTQKQARLYNEVVYGLRQELSRRIDREGWDKCMIHVIVAMTRLRQICCHPALWSPKFGDLESGKFEACLELVDSLLSGGHKVVIFSQFVECLKLLGGSLQRLGIPYLQLDGQTRNRAELVKQFQTSPEPPVFLMSLKAGGTGLTLTAAGYVILFDPWWNPAVERQAIDRVHRIGQTRQVTAYRLIAEGTIEQRVEVLKKQKSRIAESLLNSSGSFVNSLKMEDIEFLFSDVSTPVDERLESLGQVN